MNWPAVQKSFADACAEVVAFRGAHPVVAASIVSFVGGWIVAFCTFH